MLCFLTLVVMLIAGVATPAVAQVSARPLPKVPPAERLVGIAYGTWHREDCFKNHWGTPLLGQYPSDNRAVIRRHAEWLADAGVDFITPSPFQNGTPPWDDPRFTVRWMTGYLMQQPNLVDAERRISKFGYWSWEDRGPQVYTVHDGKPEAMVVSWNEWHRGEQPSPEVSKDIEPSAEFGRFYLDLMKEEIARFKSGK